MSVQVGNSPPLVAVFRNLIHAGHETNAESANQESVVTLDALAAMPRQAHLLLAHALEQRDPNLMLLENDTDVGELISAGWLSSIPCSTIGIVCLKIKPHIWHKLVSLGPTFFTPDLKRGLKSYRKSKSALYPWIWSEQVNYE
jgi:hypothetical protein